MVSSLTQSTRRAFVIGLIALWKTSFMYKLTISTEYAISLCRKYYTRMRLMVSRTSNDATSSKFILIQTQILCVKSYFQTCSCMLTLGLHTQFHTQMVLHRNHATGDQYFFTPFI